MTIYFLKERLNPETGESFDPGPFVPWYDKMFSCIVVAESEKEARRIASEADEEIGWAWLNEKYTTCEIVKNKPHKGLIIADVRWA